MIEKLCHQDLSKIAQSRVSFAQSVTLDIGSFTIFSLIHCFKQIILIKNPNFFLPAVHSGNEDGMLSSETKCIPLPVVVNAMQRLDRMLRNEHVVRHGLDDGVSHAVAVPKGVRLRVENRV